ncbi:glutathione synthase [Tricholoma matsutake]|nr:glutathione synthase [Tricholoma matsutake 945]
MTSNTVFAEWPPALSTVQLEDLTLQATTYAFSNGLLYLPPTHPQPSAPTTSIHAPLSLFPSPIPRNLFQLAKRLQRTYNILYARIAMDEEFLDRVMGADQGVGKVDDFIGQLWNGWKRLRDEGLVQPLHLGLFRSDYLLHAPPNDTISLKQVEFNTISVSFGCLSERVASLHRYLYSSTQYYNTSPHLRAEHFPENDTIAGLVEGLATAHKAYNVEGARILFVVQPGERNIFDQRPLEYRLLEGHSIHVIRQTFDELGHSIIVDPQTSVLRVACSRELNPNGFVEISTVYFRSGYVPSEYPTPAHYSTRFLLERSRAIKCPSIALQLAGGKKVQEVLTQPGVLEHFLCDKKKWGKDVFDAQHLRELRQSFMGMWGLDVGEDMLTPDDEAIKSGKEEFGTRKAREHAHTLVLKPQREGGGNNVYKDSIPVFLDKLPLHERQAWIAMELIVPPESTGNYLVRAGGADKAAVQVDVVSELGIFGWALFGGPGEVLEKEAGWLLRTKGRESDEGGVASGFSVLDSILLVDE